MAVENYQYVTTTGVIVPDTGDLLTTVQGEFQSTFGDDLILTPSTPQGILIAAETIARDQEVRNNAAVANQINPNMAGGIFLDAICALTGLLRESATPSLIRGVTMAGVPGTSIPAGVQAMTSAGDIFQSITTIILPLSGTITVDFQSVELGAIPANVADLTQIVTPVLGWETVTNPNAAILGTAQQSDQALRALRVKTLALQGVALPIAIISAVNDVSGVKSLTFLENVADTTQVIEGISMIPHSIYVCVDGGTDNDVATALLANKSLGAGWNGGTTVNVTEPVSGQVYPVKFDRPTPIAVLIRATVRASGAITDPTDAVINSILDYVNGNLPEEPGLTVGQAVSPFELGGAINIENPSIYVQKIEIALAPSGSYSTDEIPIAVNEIGTTTSGSITVVLL